MANYQNSPLDALNTAADNCNNAGHINLRTLAGMSEKVDETFEDLKPIDTVHHDEALVVLGQEHGSEDWTPEEEKQLLRKIDGKLLWILCFTYGLQYYDKAMLSQAALFGIRTDLELTGNRYSFSSAILYFGFMAGSYPASLLAQIFPIQRVAGSLVVVWGICLMLTVVCANYQSLYTQRVFLGFLEGGISPIFMLVVGGWYTKSEQALRMGLWFCCTGYFGSISPLINYGLGQITGGSLHPWQYMYLVAGAVTILWAAVIFIWLPSDPIRAKGFTPRERYIAVSRMRTNNTGVRNIHWKPEQVKEALLDPKFWLMFFIAFFVMIGNGALSTFAAIIVQSFGFSSLNSLLLTMPAGIIIGTVELLACYVACKTTTWRTAIMLACQVPTMLAALLLWQLPRHATGGLLFSIYIIGSFGATYAVMMGLTMANCAGYTKRTVYAAGLFIGYCAGNIAGPLSFDPKDAPVYAPAMVFLFAATLMTMALTLTYRYLCIWDNKKRDEAGIPEDFLNAFEDDLTDKLNPQFRYTY